MQVQKDPRLTLQKYCEDKGLPMPVYKDKSVKNDMYSLVIVSILKYLMNLSVMILNRKCNEIFKFAG